MSFLSVYESHFTQYLTATQFETLRILLWLLTVHKQVKIERLAAYFPLPILYQRKYKGKQEKEPWFILTNLDSLSEVLKVYRARAGIEAMFKDCKTGGYNLEGSKANNKRLNSLILLIAIAYTATSLKGKIFRQTNQSKYLARLTENSRRDRRHSNFWIGLYGSLWIYAWEFCSDFISIMMKHNPHKLTNYQRGLHAMFVIDKTA